MKVRELASAEWPDFLDKFSRDHRAFLATIEHTHRAAQSTEAQQRPLVAMNLDASGGSNAIVLTLHPKENPGNTIQVEHPTRMCVHETDDGQAQHVEIHGQRGERLMVRLRGVTSADTLLDGVAPGELA